MVDKEENHRLLLTVRSQRKKDNWTWRFYLTEIDSEDGLTQLLDHIFNRVFNQKEFDDFVARAI